MGNFMKSTKWQCVTAFDGSNFKAIQTYLRKTDRVGPIDVKCK